MANSEPSDQKSDNNFSKISHDVKELKEKRDEYNQKTKELINKIRDINQRVQDLRKEAAANRKIRDEYNQQVKDLKEQRNKLQERFAEIRDKIREFREKNKEKERDTPDGERPRRPISITGLRKKIQYYETRIETEEISMEEENELIKQVIQLETLLQEESQKHGNSLEYRNLVQELPKIKKQLNAIHAKLIESSKDSQECHEEMIKLYQQADELRDKKSDLEKELLQNKKIADEYHEQLLKLYADREKTRTKYKQYSKRAIQKQRKDIMTEKLAQAIEKQKQGKKLDILEARLLLEKSFKEN
ncbi:MAG: coiled-coil protein [Promethearchaeota archaeon]